MGQQWAFFCEQALETCAFAILWSTPLWDNKPMGTTSSTTSSRCFISTTVNLQPVPLDFGLDAIMKGGYGKIRQECGVGGGGRVTVA